MVCLCAALWSVRENHPAFLFINVFSENLTEIERESSLTATEDTSPNSVRISKVRLHEWPAGSLMCHLLQ